MINRLSNPIDRNRSAVKISKVMSSTIYPPSASEGERLYLPLREWSTEQTFLV